MKRLKGNYKVSKEDEKESEESKKSSTDQFEKRALEKLGGSIAFVQKTDVFVWNGDTPKKK